MFCIQFCSPQCVSVQGVGSSVVLCGANIAAEFLKNSPLELPVFPKFSIIRIKMYLYSESIRIKGREGEGIRG